MTGSMLVVLLLALDVLFLIVVYAITGELPWSIFT
jgi:hypothetical protein